MIATTTTPLPKSAQPAVADPRRSYDRGAWIGSIAADDALGTSMANQPLDLASLSIVALRRELDRRQKGIESLIAKRVKIAAELAALDAQINELRGEQKPVRRATASGAPAKLILARPKNSISLADALALAVEPRATVSPAEAAKLVLANGYQTTAAKFAMVVANALNKDKRFRRVERGRYERVA